MRKNNNRIINLKIHNYFRIKIEKWGLVCPTQVRLAHVLKQGSYLRVFFLASCLNMLELLSDFIWLWIISNFLIASVDGVPLKPQ